MKRAALVSDLREEDTLRVARVCDESVLVWRESRWVEGRAQAEDNQEEALAQFGGTMAAISPRTPLWPRRTPLVAI